MIQRTGAQLIVELLERQGVKVIAGIPGGANLPLYDALAQAGTIRHVLARHEQGAGFIAQGWARATGEAAVCLATSGPGVTNLLTAVADAKLDSIPLVCLSGQVPTTLLGTDAFQEVDTFGLAMPITKHNYLVRKAEELLRVIPEAFSLALSGRPGPVWIDIPKDVQNQTVQFEAWPEPGRPQKAVPVDRRMIEKAAAMINAARRPVLYIGGGVIQSGASGPVRTLAEQAAIPVAMTLMGLGALASDHPNALGMLGMHAARSTNMILEECDLLIALGVRFDDRATGKVSEFCPEAQVIHIDIDPGELHKIRQAHVGLVADVREALDALLPLIQTARREEWTQRTVQLRREFPLPRETADDPRRPHGLIRETARYAGPDAIVTTDVGQHQMFAAQAYPFQGPRRWLTSGGLGTMGFGLPAAIGAALAKPEATVVCFSGDGSLLMNIQELATAAEQQVNVKIILMNNNSLGLVRQQQDLFYGRRIYAADYALPVDFVKIAESFGVQAYDLAKSPDPSATLAMALAQKGPCLIHAPIDPQEKVYPMVPPGAANRDMVG